MTELNENMLDVRIRNIAALVIKTWRSRRNLTQQSLAEKLGMHQSAIAKIEGGERRIDFVTIVRISFVLGIPWDEFNILTYKKDEHD